MEPWIQPTTAPHQPDLSDEDEAVHEGAVRVERGWMEEPRPTVEAWVATQRESIGVTALTVGVVLTYIFLAVVAGPLLLLATV